MAQRITASAQGVWAWILQRITAVLLAFFLGTHLAVLHYVDENLLINFAGVAARMKSVLYLFIDGGLLLIGLYHALNGVRGRDPRLRGRGERSPLDHVRNVGPGRRLRAPGAVCPGRISEVTGVNRR